MPVTSWFSAGTVANDTSAGSLSWDSDDLGSALVGTEVATDNNVYARGKCASLTSTYYLKCTNFGITASDIPVGSTINGVEVEVRQFRGALPTISSTAVYLVKGGTVTGNNFGTAVDWATVETVVTYGSSGELGGASWTQSDITSSNFGAALSVLYGSIRTAPITNAYVDQVRTRVYYTEPASGASNASIYGAFFGLIT